MLNKAHLDMYLYIYIYIYIRIYEEIQASYIYCKIDKKIYLLFVIPSKRLVILWLGFVTAIVLKLKRNSY
jgi:hypothetical protein